MIDHPSTGERFNNHTGIRDHIEGLFIGYHTVTRLLSMEALGESRVRARVDFAEIGRLDTAFNEEGLILPIGAVLNRRTWCSPSATG